MLYVGSVGAMVNWCGINKRGIGFLGEGVAVRVLCCMRVVQVPWRRARSRCAVGYWCGVCAAYWREIL